MTLDGDRSVHIEYILQHVHQVVNSPSQEDLVWIREKGPNLPAQKCQEYGKPKNLPEQGFCIVGMRQTSNSGVVHEILERSKRGLLNVNQDGT